MQESVARLFLAQRGKCFHCGSPMLMSVATKTRNGRFNGGWTREHVVPISKGGPKAYINVVLAHKRCNERRGNRAATAEELDKHRSIWEKALTFTRKEAKRLLQDKDLRAKHVDREEPFLPELQLW